MCCNIVLESFWVFWEWAVNFAVKKPDLKILAQFENFRQVRGGQKSPKIIDFHSSWDSWLNVLQYSSRVILGILGGAVNFAVKKPDLFGNFRQVRGGQKSPKIIDFH